MHSFILILNNFFSVSLKPDRMTARAHRRPHTTAHPNCCRRVCTHDCTPHTLIAVDECVHMTVRLCASTTTHAANVRYCKFFKMPSLWMVKVRTQFVGRLGSGVRVSDNGRSSVRSVFSDTPFPSEIGRGYNADVRICGC